MRSFYGTSRKHCYHFLLSFIVSLSKTVACLPLDKPHVFGPALGRVCCATFVILLLYNPTSSTLVSQYPLFDIIETALPGQSSPAPNIVYVILLKPASQCHVSRKLGCGVSGLKEKIQLQTPYISTLANKIPIIAQPSRLIMVFPNAPAA